MKYFKYLFLCLFAIFAACGTSTTPTTAPSKPLYNPEKYACREYTVFWQDLNYNVFGGQAAIERAMALWNESLGDTRFIGLDSPSKEDNPFRDENAARSAILVYITDDQKPQGLAQYLSLYGPCACAISMLPEAANVSLLLAHELGHCLGLNHTNEPGSIMEAYVDSDAFISQENIDLVLEHTNLQDPPLELQ